ncbi:NUDIX domain-containing protein [Chloroflexota bacterium]
MSVGRFLAGIAALIWNPVDDSYLILRRAATKDFGAGNWECVTGRVDQGEGFQDALCREVQEEIGVTPHVAFMVGTSHFYRGEAIPANELVGVIYCCTVDNRAAITLCTEHDALRWVTAAEADVLFRADERRSHQWLLDVIQRVQFARDRLPPELRSFYHYRGFETN